MCTPVQGAVLGTQCLWSCDENRALVPGSVVAVCGCRLRRHRVGGSARRGDLPVVQYDAQRSWGSRFPGALELLVEFSSCRYRTEAPLPCLPPPAATAIGSQGPRRLRQAPASAPLTRQVSPAFSVVASLTDSASLSPFLF